MGKSKTTGKGRLDRFYYLAKEQGFRSRAAFKLVQLNRKYRLLSSCNSVLDLCAAPGGWMQVAAKAMPVGSLIIGVDLVPIRPIRGAFTLQEDITTPKCKSSIRKLLKERGCNVVQVVLHDGSPNIGGAWTKEASSQAALVLDSLKLAVEFLAPGGTFVTKVFRSQDYTALLYAFKQLFEKVEVTKPVASRATSAEIYVLCLRYRAPAKIDPCLLDSRHLFQEVAEPEKVVDVLRGSKQKRHRDGYEEGNTTMRKECSASEFVWAEKPLDLLGKVTAISFRDEASMLILQHPLTLEEVKVLCQDLRVLGKHEFKQILKWRLKLRDALNPSKGAQRDEPEKLEETKTVEIDEDEKLLFEMEELKEALDAKTRRSKKLNAKRKAKAKARTSTGMHVDVMEDKYNDKDLFALAVLKTKKDLNHVEDDLLEDNIEDDDGEILHGSQSTKDGDGDPSDVDADDEMHRYDAELEDYLERAYDEYRKATDGSSKRRKRSKLINVDKNAKLWEEEDMPTNLQHGESKADEDEKNPLMVDFSLEGRPSMEQVSRHWFDQDVFAELNGTEDVLSGPSTLSPVETVGIGKTIEDNAMRNSNEADGFEIVPQEPSASSDDSSDEESEYDTDDKCETLAYAKKMLRKKSRESILDEAYNRYTFNDEDLPRWFTDDEKKHAHPIKPVTKEEVQAMKAQFRSINARPVKKVAEAKARKKRRVAKKLEQARQKAATIADQEDLSSKSKGKMMERLYKKALSTPRKTKQELVVAKKGVGTRGGRGRTVVDRRMKKDMRSRGMQKKGKDKRSGGMQKKGKRRGAK